MKPTQLMEALDVCRKAGRAPNIQGPPGGGKSSIVRQYADKIDYALLLLDLPMIYDPVDTRGIPANVDGKTTWLPPEYLHFNGKPTVVFVDDYGICPPTSQANLMGLFLSRRIGGHELPESTFVIAAGNRITDAAAVHATPSALGNRMTWLKLSVDLSDWCSWALANDVETSVIAFHRFSGGTNLYPMFNDGDTPHKCGMCDKNLQPGELCGQCLRNNQAFPTLRSWTFVSDMLKHKPSPAVESDLIAGNVGIAKATEFIGYLKMYRQLPSLDSILLGPKVAPVPKDPAAMYAVATALGRMATPNNLDTVCQYLDRVPPEFSVLTMRDATQRDKDLTSTRAFAQWGTKHADVLL